MQNLRVDGTAVQLSSLFGVAASVILLHSSSPALPTWLYKVWRKCPRAWSYAPPRATYILGELGLEHHGVLHGGFDARLFLVQALKEGVETSAGSGDGFWAGHGDAGGLARLLLRCGRLEVCAHKGFGSTRRGLKVVVHRRRDKS